MEILIHYVGIGLIVSLLIMIFYVSLTEEEERVFTRDDIPGLIFTGVLFWPLLLASIIYFIIFPKN